MSGEGFKRKLTAILSADVVGYSRLMRDDEEATVRDLAAHRVLITEIIQQHHGRVVDSPGDNILAEFVSVVEAVNGAIKIQEEIRKSNTGIAEDRRMEFRIGINLGDVIEEEERIYGDGVNIAARVEGLAAGGGIAISGTVYEHIKEKLTLGYHYLGEQDVKNISEPVRVYRLLTEPANAGKMIGEKKSKSRRLRWAASGAIALIVLVVCGIAIWNFYFRPSFEPASVEKMAYPLPDRPSIAVLAFDNLSEDPKQEYFSDGITENIITGLSKVRDLFVIARNSSFTYKGKPVKIQKVSEDLGVRYVLEGSVMKSGDRVRITAQLIDAVKGHHIWAERYDRNLSDIFAVQDDITIKILNALHVKLTKKHELIKHGTNNLDAYLKLFEGSSYLYRHTKKGNLKAKQLYEEAIALDPEYIWPQVTLGWAHFFDARFGWVESPRKSIKKAFVLAKKALERDDELALGHSLMGVLYMITKDFDKAIEECERGVALNPNGSDIMMTLGAILSVSGRWEEGAKWLEKSIRHEPFPTMHYFYWLGRAYVMLDRYKEAVTQFEKAHQTSPESPLPFIGLAIAYSLSGREQASKKAAEEVMRINPKFSIANYSKTVPYKKQSDKDIWLRALRKAGVPEIPLLPLPAKPSIAVLPFVNISGDPKEDYLSDGITEDIITALSKTPRMLVIARNSVFTYKGKPVMVQQVSKELGVRYVLEGSVQRSGNRLRITAQLIDAKTGNHLWSERYDRDLKDLFDLQDDITRNVIMALQVKLTQGDSARIYGKNTANLEAYLKVMKGLLHVNRYNKGDNEIARRLYGEAIAVDPNYVNAYVLLAWAFHNEAKFLWTKTPAKSYEKAIELAKKAISLDELNANAYMVFANVYAMTGQFEKAMAAGKKGLSLDPANTEVNATFGVALNNAGKFKEAIPWIKKAIRIDPKHPNWYLLILGWSYFYTGQQEAITAFKKSVSREPSDALAHASLGFALIAGGKPEEAVAMFEKALNLNPDGPGFYVGHLAVARHGAGQPEEAITTLRAVLSRDPENVEAWLSLSIILTSEGKYEEALSVAKKAVSLKERGLSSITPTTIFYWRIGTSYHMMGQYEEAIAAFKKAISFWPDYVYGQVGLTASYSLAGRIEEARAEASEVLRINPKISLEGIAKNGFYNFKKADKERFINALHKAGLM